MKNFLLKLKLFRGFGLMMPFVFLVVSQQVYAQEEIEVTGTVTGANDNVPLPSVNIVVKNTSKGTLTDFDGNFTLKTPEDAILVFSSVGFKTLELPVDGKTEINASLEEDIGNLDEVVVTGYSTQEKKSITGSISTVTSDDLEKVKGGGTVTSGLAGKIPGVSFRMNDGRPGSGASIQIRNMGNPLYVIDGVQQDAGQFNNLSPQDIASISVLKDASAAIYGLRAANGVVVVTTKRGKRGTRNTINVNSYYGWQNWTRFPEATSDSYQWQLGKVEADVNKTGTTDITPEELEKYRIGEEYGYQSFNWRDFIVKGDAPQSSIQVNATGGSENINYYLSYTKLHQDAVFGDQWTFDRNNIQSNVDADISDRLKVGVQINGRIESRRHPGVPGGDDFFAPRFAILRNRPYERPYANDNPEYVNDIGHNTENWALQNFELGGYSEEDWRQLQTNFTAEYALPYVEGLKAKATYSFYLADRLKNGHEYTYDVYKYNPQTEEYSINGGSSNPFRERIYEKQFRNTFTAQLNYKRSINDHNLEALFIVERRDSKNIRTSFNSVPKTNELPLIYFQDLSGFNDEEAEEARIGYIGRLNYNYKDKYYVEVSGRRDASWKFAPSKRVGFFPSASVGWRMTEEPFIKNILGDNTVVNGVKLRASYGLLGDDDIGIGAFDYLVGYNYNVGAPAIFGGEAVIPIQDRGQPITNITWFKSRILDIGVDFYLFDNKLSGSYDYFYRERTGLRGRKYDILVPDELGYSLPDENVNSDAQYGIEGALTYADNFGDVDFSVSANGILTRSKFLDSYKPRFNNSWDEYRNSSEHRYNTSFWGLTAIGQFQSQEQIDEYPVNHDGQGNKTLLPGDLIFKDFNNDGRIDGYDDRPIGYTNFNPAVSFGLSLNVAYKGFDMTADFSGASKFSWNQNYEARNPYQNTGALNKIFLDRWHRADPFDPNSEWIPGKYPPLRFNDGGTSSSRNSTFWLHNVTYLKARTLELGYSLPKELLDKINVQKFRVYINAYNLFSIDNLEEYGVDPETSADNALDYPQNRFVNVGFNLSL